MIKIVNYLLVFIIYYRIPKIYNLTQNYSQVMNIYKAFTIYSPDYIIS
jgi:hypothetical protein